MPAVVASILIGFCVALVGAWKDIVWEPFSFRTFMRTPIICTFWGVVLVIFLKDKDWFLIALSAIALERLSVELWKALFRKMPSKFKSKSRDTQWLKIRLRRYTKF